MVSWHYLNRKQILTAIGLLNFDFAEAVESENRARKYCPACDRRTTERSEETGLVKIYCKMRDSEVNAVDTCDDFKAEK